MKANEQNLTRDFSDEALTAEIIECVIKVHTTLGPGFVESIYQNAMMIELAHRGMPAEAEQEVMVYYEGKPVGKHRLDIVVMEKGILELKAIDQLGKAHYAQLRSYLRASGLNLGLLINFATEKAESDESKCEGGS